MISSADEKNIEEIISKLLEHYDSVRIFVTRHSGEKEESGSFDSGGGSFYAQLGQVREWLIIQDQYVKNYVDKKQRKP